MAPDEKPDDQRLLSHVRVAGADLTLFLIVVLTLGEVFQLPFLREGFHVEPTVFGILVTTFCILVGVEAIARLPGIGKDK